MTKEQFLKTYGQPNTVVSFKNDAEKMEFLKECEVFGFKWRDGKEAMYHKYDSLEAICMHKGEWMTTDNLNYFNKESFKVIPYTPYTPSPKSLIKDGWMGVQRNGLKIHLLPSIDLYVCADSQSYRINEFYYDDLQYKPGRSKDIMELYDNLGNLQWKREEKSAKDIEIERIQAEMNKLADDLSKLKGE